MEHDAHDTSGRPTEPDPPQDRAGKTVPERIAAVLHAVRTLFGYGRHLTETVHQRAADPTFTTIAVCFGTTRAAAILAHLQRGILRAMALEHVLLARAESGRDIEFVERRNRAATPPPAEPPGEPVAAPCDPQAAPEPPLDPRATPDPDQSAEPLAAAPVARKAAKRPSRPAGWDDPELFMPTLEELIAQVRRRPIGRTIVDICLDCGVVPGLCAGPFWNLLFDIMRHFGGSLVGMMRERERRQEVFVREQDRRPTSTWQWWNLTREKTRQVMGFFIGEPPVNPFAVVPVDAGPGAAVATGPP